MPSPFAHGFVGYLIYRTSRGKLLTGSPSKKGDPPLLMVVIVILSLLPDFDAAAGLLKGDFAAYHNNATHSLITGLAVALGLAGMLAWRYKIKFAVWFFVFLAAYWLHVIMDAFTFGRGVMLFWPFSVTRFEFPIKLFLGVRWSEGILSINHLFTLATESIFVLAAFLLVRWLEVRLQPAKS